MWIYHDNSLLIKALEVLKSVLEEHLAAYYIYQCVFSESCILA